jgi:hypothetical protein
MANHGPQAIPSLLAVSCIALKLKPGKVADNYKPAMQETLGGGHPGKKVRLSEK